MLFLGKTIDSLKLEDIQELAHRGIPEECSLEFKTKLPLKSEEDKREFLADVTAMGNGGGGVIIYGVGETSNTERTTAVARPVPGVFVEDVDSEILRLEGMLTDGIRPRIQNIRIKSIEISNNCYLIIIAIPRSLFSPHMITQGGLQRFVSRNSAGKYRMDIDDIRSSVLASASLVTRVESWSTDRARRIVVGGGPTQMASNRLIVLHLIPLSSADDLSSSVPMDFLAAQQNFLWPIGSNFRSIQHRYHLDGYLGLSRNSDAVCFGYVLAFRKGQIEAADSRILERAFREGQLHQYEFEGSIVQSCNHYLKAMKNLGIEPPIFIQIQLSNIRGLKCATTHLIGMDSPYPIEEVNITLPSIYLQEWNSELSVAKILRPAFDGLWNACGYPCSPNYDDNGNWTGTLS